MKEPTEGRILLVGEGNFSLSASLVEGGTISGPQLIATCRETFTAVQENHQLAASNIDFLENAGATVVFEVDATDLHNHPDINFYHFARVIFNFPLADRHNIKKNRALLSDFFSSVKNILDPEKGQVMVTLCKGQGGTPADQPVRSWHDSWQVVSMAANAGLILTQIYPFQAEEFIRYKSVGFRFQDKGFQTEKALTHVFEVAPSISAVPVVSHGHCIQELRNQQFVVPAYIRRKHDRWSLLNKEGHPVYTLLHHLNTCLGHIFPTHIHLPPNPAVLPKVLPGHRSSLRVLPCLDHAVAADQDSDDGQMNNDDMKLVTRGGDQDEHFTGVCVTSPLTMPGDNVRGQADVTGVSTQMEMGERRRPELTSKDLKELENRQKVAAGPGQHGGNRGVDPDTNSLTGEDERMTDGSKNTASDDMSQHADSAVEGDPVSLQPFQHGVEREGAGPELGTDSQRLGNAGSGVPTFPPLDCPVFVVHTLTQPDQLHQWTDLSTQAPPPGQKAADCQHEAMDVGCTENGEAVETADRNSMVLEKNSSEAEKTVPRTHPRESETALPVNSLFHLRCSLLENLSHFQRCMKARSEKVTFTSGTVFRKCSISPSEMVASHEALLLAQPEEGGVEKLVKQLCIALKAVMDEDNAAGLTATSITKCVNVGETGSLTISVAFTLQTKGGQSCATLGHVFSFESGESYGSEGESGTARGSVMGAVFYLDSVLFHALRLPDVRLLWSEDRRFLGQFTKGGDPVATLSTFRPFSLYPVRFVHDISFWENPQCVFEEGEFLDVVREIADDAVTSVSLVDCFDHTDSGQTSRCYRLVFQSHDHALSYITSWRLQSFLRIKVAQQLGVTLR